MPRRIAFLSAGLALVLGCVGDARERREVVRQRAVVANDLDALCAEAVRRYQASLATGADPSPEADPLLGAAGALLSSGAPSSAGRALLESVRQAEPAQRVPLLRRAASDAGLERYCPGLPDDYDLQLPDRPGRDDPDSSADISDAAFLRALASKRPAFNACFRDELERHPGADGTVVVGFNVNPDGTTSAAHVVDDAVHSNPLGVCLADAVGDLLVPRAKDAKVTAMHYRFRISPRARASYASGG